MPRRLEEGTWFAVPLARGFAAGLLVRAGGPIGFGYFFGPRFDSLPGLPELSARMPSDSILACRLSLGALRDGDWPTLGAAPSWRRGEWPIPPLCRFDELQQHYVLVLYGDDPVSPERELPLPTGQSPETLPSDDAVGHRLIPTYLSRALG